jgi:hypothetical protein
MDIKAPDGRILIPSSDLACPCCGGLTLAPGFADHLTALCLAWDKPVSVNSCCRCSKRNINVGGHARSLHVFDTPHWPTRGTCAIDLKTTNAQEAMKLMLCAADLGWSVGVPAGRFIHLDRREIGGLKPSALFGYGG